MVKTRGGKAIYLDNDFEANGRPGVSWTTNFCWMFLVMCVLGPVQFFLWTGEGMQYRFMDVGLHLWFFFLVLAICSGCVIFFRISLFRLRHPMAYHWVQMVGFSFRLFYVGSLLWLSLSSVGWWAYMVVIVLWAFSEITNYYETRRVSDDEIAKAFQKRFRLHSDGYLLYNPVASVKDLHKRSRAPWVKWRDRFETFGAAIGVIIGPALFIRSQLYRDNFEPRYLIMAAIVLALAMALRGMTTEVAIARRALKLKQQEGLTS